MKSASFRSSLEDVVLAWLVVPRKKPSHDDLTKALAPMFEDDHAVTKKAIAKAFLKLQADGCTEVKKGGKSENPPLKLTDKGRQAALAFLGIANVPPKEDWRWIKKVLWLRSVGLPVTNVLLQKAGDAEWKAACMLALASGIPVREDLSLSDVVDTLLWRVLAGKVPPPEDKVDLETFARRVNEAALAAPTGRWSDGKVFISHVYEEMKRRHHAEGRTPEEFKWRLLEAYNAQLVRLNRADLVAALPQDDVSSSQTDDGNVTFHFVRIDHLKQPGQLELLGRQRSR